MPRRNTAFPFDKVDQGFAVFMMQQSLYGRSGRTHFCVNRQTCIGKVIEGKIAKPVDIAQHQGMGCQCLAWAYNDAIFGAIKMHNVKRLIGSNADAATLPYRKVNNALVGGPCCA